MIEADLKRNSDAAIARLKARAKEGEDISEATQAAAAQAAKEVENTYKLFFILRKVAHDQKINPSSQEVMHEMMRQMFAVNPAERIIDPQGDPQESRSRIHSYLVEQQAKDWLIEQATAKKEKA
jgi:FKBP-type peptidyl-prolyl cis-trans isomerase (trigger factor)